MALNWDASYAVGHATIDQQHQELFVRVNALIGAMQDQRGLGEVEKLLGFLASYVVEHFGAEERLMREHAFPGAAAHVAEHRALVEEMKGIAAAVKASGVSPALTIKLNRRLTSWLLDHIARVDRQLAKFLAAKKAA